MYIALNNAIPTINIFQYNKDITTTIVADSTLLSSPSLLYQLFQDELDSTLIQLDIKKKIYYSSKYYY